jgi:hypothetical protein
VSEREQHQDRGSAARRWTIALALAVLVLPVVADLAGDLRRVFGYLAPDVFYYLTVARSQHEIGLLSFDGEYRTNGYHPLWQWLLCPVYALLDMLGALEVILPVLVLASAVLIAGALVLLGRALTRTDGGLSPLFPVLVPGVAALISTPLYQPSADRGPFQDPAAARPIFTTLWSYANGMETPLLLLAFAAAMLFVVRHERLTSRAQASSFAALLLTLTFARLDHVFFAGVLLMTVVAHAWRTSDRESLRWALYAGAGFVLGVLIYMVGNQLVYGVPMPISGEYKSSFPHISTNTLQRLWGLLTDPPEQWMSGATRLFQLLFPLLIAAIYLPLNLRWVREPAAPPPITLPAWLPARPRWLPRIALRPGRDRVDAVLCWTACAVLILGAYNTLFVLLVHTGPWYFPISSLFVSLVFITSFQRFADRVVRVRTLTASPRGAAMVLVLTTAVSAAYFVRAQYRPLYLAEQAAFYYDVAPKVRAYYGDAPPKLVEYDDGIVTFATGFPAMSGFGLTLDSEAMAAKQRGKLVNLAIDRGYDHVASSNYVLFQQEKLPTSAQASRAYKWIKKSERQGLEFIPEFHSPESGFVIFKVVRKPPEASEGDDEETDEP